MKGKYVKRHEECTQSNYDCACIHNLISCSTTYFETCVGMYLSIFCCHLSHNLAVEPDWMAQKVFFCSVQTLA